MFKNFLKNEKLVQKKRLFLAFRVLSPWKSKTFEGKLIAPSMRHITIAFLGQTDMVVYEKLLPKLKTKLSLDFPVWGYFDHFLPLPPRQTRALTWHARFIQHQEKIFNFVQDIKAFFEDEGLLKKEDKAWLPHVSICRKPFDYLKWKTSFECLPFICDAICVYESLGNLKYQAIYTEPLLLPFTEKDNELIFLDEECSLYKELAMSYLGQKAFDPHL